jgi:hypothetical protein
MSYVLVSLYLTGMRLQEHPLSYEEWKMSGLWTWIDTGKKVASEQWGMFGEYQEKTNSRVYGVDDHH